MCYKIDNDFVTHFLYVMLNLPLWLAQNWLERGGRVCEPQTGLTSRALSKSENHRLR